MDKVPGWPLAPHFSQFRSGHLPGLCLQILRRSRGNRPSARRRGSGRAHLKSPRILSGLALGHRFTSFRPLVLLPLNFLNPGRASAPELPVHRQIGLRDIFSSGELPPHPKPLLLHHFGLSSPDFAKSQLWRTPKKIGGIIRPGRLLPPAFRLLPFAFCLPPLPSTRP
jgi:hypothetical protein